MWLAMIFVNTHDVCETCKCLSKVVSNVIRLAGSGRTHCVPGFFIMTGHSFGDGAMTDDSRLRPFPRGIPSFSSKAQAGVSRA